MSFDIADLIQVRPVNGVGGAAFFMRDVGGSQPAVCIFLGTLDDVTLQAELVRDALRFAVSEAARPLNAEIVRLQTELETVTEQRDQQKTSYERINCEHMDTIIQIARERDKLGGELDELAARHDKASENFAAVAAHCNRARLALEHIKDHWFITSATRQMILDAIKYEPNNA